MIINDDIIKTPFLMLTNTFSEIIRLETYIEKPFYLPIVNTINITIY